MTKIDYYEVREYEEFKGAVTRFVKKKKYKKLPYQLLEVEESLAKGDFLGTMTKKSDEPIPHEVYKLRLPNKDTKTGKSKGYRLFYMVVTQAKIIVLMTIYYKPETEALTDNYIDGLISGIFLESLPYDDEDAEEDWDE
ncbi:MAG: hypothetical protein LBE35_08710 [Clostridiales bacterium]|jgi:mRNA-degrading endonuclease RelE of RelBE toxin-antitoxin system|nr:hypothetical protein [Clostridiales bacterium]